MPLTDLEYSHNLPEHSQVDLRLILSSLKDADQATQAIAIVLDGLVERKYL